jgi:hypothetical protein
MLRLHAACGHQHDRPVARAGDCTEILDGCILRYVGGVCKSTKAESQIDPLGEQCLSVIVDQGWCIC